MQRVNQHKEICKIAGGAVDRARTPVPPIAPRFFYTSGGCKNIQCSGYVIEARPAIVKLKPILHFAQIAVGVVGEIFLHQVGARLLRVFEDESAI